MTPTSGSGYWRVKRGRCATCGSRAQWAPGSARLALSLCVRCFKLKAKAERPPVQKDPW